jgi:hypothetical protein
MTFSYDLTAGFTDLARVRQALGDTDASAPRFSDEEIAATLAEHGGWQMAVLALIDSLLARLSLPDFQADWLRVDHGAARRGYADLRQRLRRQYGLAGAVVGRAGHVYRADGAPPDTPDYAGGTP